MLEFLLSRDPELPRIDLSWRLLGEALLDGTLALTSGALLGAPPPEQLRRARDELVAARRLFGERGWLEDPASYHREPAPITTGKLRKRGFWQTNGRRHYRHLRVASGWAPHPDEPGRERWLAHPSNDTAHVQLLEHEEPRPWLVCVHGFAMGGARVNMTGFPVRLLHEDLGLNLAFPVLPLHGRRGAALLSGSEVFAPDHLRMVHLFAQAAWDVRRLVRWLRARGAARVGLYGVSLGGYVASLVASLEDGLDCVIAGIPPADFPNLARDNEPRVMSQLSEELRVDWDLVRAVNHPVSPLALAPRVPHAGRFIYAGVADRVVKPYQPRSLWRHWGKPEIHWFSGGHVLGVMNRSVGPFLERSLVGSGLA